VNDVLSDTDQIQQALEEYCGKKLQGRENIGISDVNDIGEDMPLLEGR
jgi:hypothetical protein